MTIGNSNRIGAGSGQQPQPQPQSTVNQSTPFMDSIRKSAVKSFNDLNIKVDMNVLGGPSPDLLSSFDKSEWASIGKILNKLGSRVQGIQEAKVALQVPMEICFLSQHHFLNCITSWKQTIYQA